MVERSQQTYLDKYNLPSSYLYLQPGFRMYRFSGCHFEKRKICLIESTLLQEWVGLLNGCLLCKLKLFCLLWSFFYQMSLHPLITVSSVQKCPYVFHSSYHHAVCSHDPCQSIMDALFFSDLYGCDLLLSNSNIYHPLREH